MDKREGNTMTEIIAAAKEKGYSSDQILEAFARTLDGMEPKANAQDSNTRMDIRVSEIMTLLGVPAHIKGHAYLRSALLIVLENSKMESVTKVIYPKVAKMHQTTSSRVERAIRHAIEVTWERGNADVLLKVFGYTISAEKGKPTNSEFIALISDKIRLGQI